MTLKGASWYKLPHSEQKVAYHHAGDSYIIRASSRSTRLIYGADFFSLPSLFRSYVANEYTKRLSALLSNDNDIHSHSALPSKLQKQQANCKSCLGYHLSRS
jgi:hypothetical protein